MSMIHVRIVTPHGIYREFDTPILNVDTTEGMQGILPNHMPLVTMLDIGKMSADINGEREEFAVAGGLLYFRDNMAEVLSDAVEHEDDIDEERAEAAKKRAEERLASHDPNIDMRRAETALKKAMNRLEVKRF